METNTDSILIVDDDPEIRRLLVDYLARNGYTALAARDGREMWHMLDRHAIDLIVLDLMLPDTDGLTLCRDLRARPKSSAQQAIPVLMLTARGEETDRIIGIEMGADDYLVKPFNPRELLARIKTILRRTRALPPNLRPEPARYLVFAGWCLDTAARLLTPSAAPSAARACRLRRSRGHPFPVGVLPRHHETQDVARRVAGHDADDAAAVHDHDPISEGGHLVQLRRDDDDRDAGVARLDDAFVDELDRPDIHSAGRL